MELIDNATLDSIMFETCNSHYLYSKELAVVAITQYTTGCRANDILQLNRWSVVDINTVRLAPQKGNNPRDFSVSILEPALIDAIFGNINIFQGLFYRKYSYYIDLALHRYNFTLGSKGIGSHLFRHNYARKLKDSGLTDSQVKDAIGERSQSSANAYIYSQIYFTGL